MTWTSLDKELPPDSKDVLFWNGTHLFAGHMQNVTCEDEIIDRVFICYSFDDYSFVSRERQPTHWMPTHKRPDESPCKHEWGSEELQGAEAAHYICNNCGDKLKTPVHNWDKPENLQIWSGQGPA